jgi:hypothetical protein
MALINRILGIRDILERATTFDTWGQVLEADVEYKKMIGEIAALTKTGEPMPFIDSQVKFMDNCAAAVHMRSKAAQELEGEFGIRLDQVMRLIPMIEPTMCVPEPDIDEFPIKEVLAQSRNLDEIFGSIHMGPTTSKHQPKYNYTNAGRQNYDNRAAPAPATEDDDLDDDDDDNMDDEGADTPEPETDKGGKKQKAAAAGGGPQATAQTLQGTLQQFNRFPGQTNISITILKIRLKDPHQFIEPFICVSVKDSLGQTIRQISPQDTPYSTKADDEFIYFNQVVHLQLPLEALQSAEAAIFMEFKHYKVKKNKQSVKCWSMLEMDELNAVNGVEMPLEIYQKPTDFKKKKLMLLTDKAYYLYVHITRTTD